MSCLLNKLLRLYSYINAIFCCTNMFPFQCTAHASCKFIYAVSLLYRFFFFYYSFFFFLDRWCCLYFLILCIISVFNFCTFSENLSQGANKQHCLSFPLLSFSLLFPLFSSSFPSPFYLSFSLSYLRKILPRYSVIESSSTFFRMNFSVWNLLFKMNKHSFEATTKAKRVSHY